MGENAEKALAVSMARLGSESVIQRRFRTSRILAMHPEAMQVTPEPREVEECCEVVDGIAVLCIEGELESKKSAVSSWWGFDCYEHILSRFKAAICDDEVSSILLKIDSPGGDASGLNECCDAMLRLKEEYGKPVVAYADEGAYSAAYAIACVADEIYLPRAGGLGSIGVRSGIQSMWRAMKKAGVDVELIASGDRKLDGDPMVPITDAARAHVQRRVNQLAGLYFKLVSKTRGMSVQAVKDLEADTFYGQKAVDVGLADGILSLHEVVSLMRGLDSWGRNGSRLTQVNSTHGSPMNLLALTKAVNDARAKLKAAKKPLDKAEAADALEIAKARLEAAKAGVKAKSATSKSTYKKKTVEEEETQDDPEDDDEDPDDPEGDEDEDEDEEASAEEDEEEEEKMPPAKDKKAKKASRPATLAASGSLKSRLATMLGTANPDEIVGAVAGLVDGQQTMNKRLAKIEASDRNRKVESLIAQGKASRQITPGNESKVRAETAKLGVGYLQSYLRTAPAAIVEEYREPEREDDTDQEVTIDKAQRKIWAKQGLNEEQMQFAAKALAARKATLARITNGSN